MQTLGRVAIIAARAGAVINLYMFSGVQELSETGKVGIYRRIYLMRCAFRHFVAAC